jgi:TonB family protein
MQAPRKIVNVAPRYPTHAQLARIEGVVVLDAVIDATGRVTDVQVTRSIPALDQAAIDAVRQSDLRQRFAAAANRPRSHSL